MTSQPVTVAGQHPELIRALALTILYRAVATREVRDEIVSEIRASLESAMNMTLEEAP